MEGMDMTQTQQQSAVKNPLVKITELDHIVLRVQDVERSLRFYTEVLGLQPERVEQWRAGEIRFPSVRLNADTIIDLFATSQHPIEKNGIRNQDHFCMVIEPTDMDALKSEFEEIGVEIQTGPGKRWGSHGDGISLYIYDPDDNVVELRHY
jgi:catechol 2,3-dioxygenase-like lactoylglutathione lyase family enzyme